jgi:hypothetical protein
MEQINRLIQKIKLSLKNFVKNFEQSTIQYVKTNTVALLLLVGIILFFVLWLWPNQQEIDKKVYLKNTELSNNYNNENKIIDSQKEQKLELQLKDIKAPRKLFLILDWFTYSVVGIVMTALLATLLQWLYTKLKFTDNPEATQRVLSAALFSSALIVCIVFIIKYYPVIASPVTDGF